MADQESPKEPAGIQVQLRWEDGSDLDVQCANQVIVSHGNGEFYIVFGQAFSPHIPDLSKRPDDVPDHISVKPVARLVICPEAMLKIMAALGDNTARFLQAKQQKHDPGGDEVAPKEA